MRVKTVRGGLIKKINTIMYDGQYYSKKEDCVKLGGKYYPLIHPDIAFDEELKEYALRSRMYHGIVAFEGEEPIYGYFSANDSENTTCRISPKIKSIAIREQIIPSSYVECLWSGEYYNPKNYGASEIANIQRVQTINAHTDKGYNIEDNAKEYENKQKSYAAWKPVIPKRIRRYGKLLGNLSFGVENEVTIGSIPPKHQLRHGLVLCRDGSTPAGEFVSVPMTGPKGVLNICKIGEEMSKRTFTDNSCSYHIHIGTIQTSRVFLLAVYKLVERIQDELFTMLPYYKTFWKNIKRKNYNQKLEPMFPVYKPNQRIGKFRDYVRYNYCKLFRFLASNDTLPSKKYNRKQLRHPVTSGKWNIRSRLTK
jgi:hypothetical protein